MCSFFEWFLSIVSAPSFSFSFHSLAILDQLKEDFCGFFLTIVFIFSDFLVHQEQPFHQPHLRSLTGQKSLFLTHTTCALLVGRGIFLILEPKLKNQPNFFFFFFFFSFKLWQAPCKGNGSFSRSGTNN